MGQHHHIIDELARMERICRDLAGQAAMPEERAGLLVMANNGAEISDRERDNRFAETVQTRGISGHLSVWLKLLILAW